MALVEILDVQQRNLDRERLRGFHLDLPTGATGNDSYAIHVAGWALGRTHPVLVIELLHEEVLVRDNPLCMQRPGVTAKFPEAPKDEKCGFYMSLGTLGLRAEFELQVDAVLGDRSRVTLGTIRGRQQALNSGFTPKLQPLMITSMGRTGTTLLMRLLAEHPQIVA